MNEPNRQPILPLHARSLIEQAKKKIKDSADERWSYLVRPRFDPLDLDELDREAMPATLQVQFREYSCELLDATAQQLLIYAKNSLEFRSGLEASAREVASEALREYGSHNQFHCTKSDLKRSIQGALEERVAHWAQVEAITGREGRPVVSIERTKEEILRLPIPTKTMSDRLDEATDKLGISHEELAYRIQISRTTYFQVKAGKAGRKAIRKAELYLANVFKEIRTKTGPKSY